MGVVPRRRSLAHPTPRPSPHGEGTLALWPTAAHHRRVEPIRAMDQPDLFGADPPAPAWRPDPVKVRARLERILGQARAADALPWESSQVSLYKTIVPDMTRWLPDDEAAAWRAEFEAQMARLETA